MTTTSTPPSRTPPPPPARGPRPNYALRRAVAAGVALLVLILFVLLVRAVLGGGSGDGAAPPTAVEESPITTEAPTTTTTAVVGFPRHNDLSQPPTFALREPPLRTVSEADPLTVWVLGDSTAQALGQLFENQVKDVPGIQARTIYKNSTGLTRQDFYDWPAALPSYLAEGAPDVVVLSMGDNDAQALQPQGSTTYVDVDSPQWLTEYSRRLGGFVDQLTAAGSRVYVVGQPVMRSETFNARIAVVDSAYRALAAADPDITYVDAKALLADDAGAYTDALPGAGGAAVTVRNSDGIHLSVEGARWLARVVARQVGSDYGIQAP